MHKPIVVWCQAPDCREGFIPANRRRVDKLSGTWRCPDHTEAKGR